MKIIVTLRNVYGETKVYPVCRKAKLFAAIAGTKTLTRSTLEHIIDMGVEVRIDDIDTIGAQMACIA